MSFVLERLVNPRSEFLARGEGKSCGNPRYANARRNDENEVICNHFAEIREATYDAEDVIEL